MTELVKTGEQDTIIDAIDSHDIIKVNAFAGTGKTTTLYEMTKAYPNLNFLYLVFNKELRKEAEDKFNSENTTAKTTHAFALSHVRNELNINHRKNGLQNGIMVHELQHTLNMPKYRHALLLKQLFMAYCQSGYELIDAATVKALLGEDRALRIDFMSEGIKTDRMVDKMKMLWTKIQNDDLPMIHDFYLKFFQLNVDYFNDRINYDVILLDEAQDSNNVTLSIFNKFSGKKVLVGDRYQAIYGWRKATNVMDKITADVDLNLTTTFRFGQAIANRANNILQEVFGETNEIVPFFPTIEKDLGASCRITRTNAGLIRELKNLSESGKLVKTVRKPAEIFSMPLSVLYFTTNKFKYKAQITEKRLWQFKSTEDMKDHAKAMKDIELLIAIKLVDDYGMELEDLFELAKENHRKRKDIDIYLTTAHTAKGKEWDSVMVMDDFQDLLELMLDARIYSMKDLRNTIKKNYSKVQSVAEEFNLFYVAITRGIVDVDVISKNLSYLSLSEFELNEELMKMKSIRDKEDSSQKNWKNRSKR